MNQRIRIKHFLNRGPTIGRFVGMRCWSRYVSKWWAKQHRKESEAPK